MEVVDLGGGGPGWHQPLHPSGHAKRMRHRRLRLAAFALVGPRFVHSLAAVTSVARSGTQRGYSRDGISLVRNFLSPEAFALVCEDTRKLRGQLKPEKGSMAVGRLGRILDSRSDAYAMLTSDETAGRINHLTQPAKPLVASEYPIELRVYRVGSGMDWHVDDALYTAPQCELVLVLDNTSDSVTEWTDATGELHSEWTPPNSALLVRAGGARHRVQPLRRGERTILKMVWCETGSTPLEDRFYDHLDSLPGLRSKQRPKRGGDAGRGARGRKRRGK